MKKLQKSILACLFSLSITSLNAQSFNEIIKAVASDRAAMDNFGTSVSISGDYAIITVPGDGESATGVNSMSYAGSAYIFERNSSGMWIEVQKIVTSDRAVDDQFGASASISGDYAVVSTIYEDEDATGGNTMNSAGSAYIFERNSLGIWSEAQKIVASDRAFGDRFGIKEWTYSDDVSGWEAGQGFNSIIASQSYTTYSTNNEFNKPQGIEFHSGKYCRCIKE